MCVNHNFKKSLILLSIVLGLISGTAAFGLAKSQFKSKPSFPSNASGQTYGSALYAETPEDEPDLIKAIGVDGNIGYVKATDLDENPPNSPNEAVKLKSRSAREIPLYDIDGKTIIGTFIIEPSNITIKK